MEPEKIRHHSFIVRVFSAVVEWGNEWLTLSHWFFKRSDYIFLKIEAMMLCITGVCLTLPFWVDRIPSIMYPLLYAFFIQRILEFVIVYSRNFILRRGHIYSHAQFQSDQHRGTWLLLMFSLSVLQIVTIFGSWTRLLSFLDPNAFSRPIDGLDGLYFSAVTFLTIGFGDIAPVTTAAKFLMLTEGVLTFFVVVVVINGLTSTHFGAPLDSASPQNPK
jgi:Ion channel